MLIALLLAACAPAPPPNEALARACRNEPESWRSATVSTNVILTAEFVNLVDPRLHWASVGSAAGDNCLQCVRWLRQGFASVEYLPRMASNLDRVSRYSFAPEGDRRCNEFARATEQWSSVMGIRPPRGRCLAVERNVRRAARYGVNMYTEDRPRAGIEAWIYQVVDLQDLRVLARVAEVHQIGLQGQVYSCSDVNIRRDIGNAYIAQSIRPASP